VLKAEIDHQRRRSWKLRWVRKLGRAYLGHAGSILFLFSWLAINLASPRLRTHWRGQLPILVILAFPQLVAWIRKSRG
jgi:hypothetical protein